MKCILLLDSCKAHKDIGKVENYVKPPNLSIVFFPTNLTSRRQVATMGFIAVLEVGYKGRMLQISLDIFDECSNFDLAEQQKKIRKRVVEFNMAEKLQSWVPCPY